MMIREELPGASYWWDDAILDQAAVKRILASTNLELSREYPEEAYQLALTKQTTRFAWELLESPVRSKTLKRFDTSLQKLEAVAEHVTDRPPRGAFRTLSQWAREDTRRSRKGRPRDRFAAYSYPWLMSFFLFAFETKTLSKGARGAPATFIGSYFQELNMALWKVGVADPEERGRIARKLDVKTPEAIRQQIPKYVADAQELKGLIRYELQSAADFLDYVKDNK